MRRTDIPNTLFTEQSNFDYVPEHYLHEIIDCYEQKIEDYKFREKQYQNYLTDLKKENEALKAENEKYLFVIEQVEKRNIDSERYKTVLDEAEDILQDMQSRVRDLELSAKKLEFENEKKNDEVTKLKSELTTYKTQEQLVNQPRSAVDIQALLRKKEKEVRLKFQREIVDLKRQVDTMLEAKAFRAELDWLSNR